MAFVLGKAKIMLGNQTNWLISRKELEAAEMGTKSIKDESKSLQHFKYSFYLLSDFCSHIFALWPYTLASH